MDDHGSHSRHPAGAASPRAPGRRPLRHVRPQRSLPPRHQPQQPSEAAHGARRSRNHHPQRKAHAAGSRRRPVRQRPPRPRHRRHERPPAQVPFRHDQGQAGPLPPEPARQACRLLRPFRHLRGPVPEDPSVRPAEEDGPRALQALHLRRTRKERPGLHHQERQKDGRARRTRGLGHPGRRRQGIPCHAEPRAYAAQARHPGL